MRYEPLLQTIADRYSEILGNNLVGVYIHGSIAFQCFNWDESDIDFIVVVSHEISRQNKLDLLGVLDELRDQAPAKGLEMSIVQQRFCQHFEYPTPYELHFSNAFLDQYSENPMTLCTSELKADHDLAAHFTVIKHTGIVLCGQSISMVFGDIPKKDYIDSICLDIQNSKQDVLDDPARVVLNLCRVYAYLKDSLTLSKEQGGQWGLRHLPDQYANIITESIDHYSSSKPFRVSDELKIEFCDHMLKEITLFALVS